MILVLNFRAFPFGQNNFIQLIRKNSTQNAIISGYNCSATIITYFYQRITRQKKKKIKKYT